MANSFDNIEVRTLRDVLANLDVSNNGQVVGTDLTATIVTPEIPGGYATAAQGALADTALQPGEAATPEQGILASTAFARPAVAGFYYASDYGVLADNSTDNAVALNTLVTTVSQAGGGVIVLPEGVTRVASVINWKPYVSLLGAGLYATTLRGMTNGQRILNFENIWCQGISVSHLTIQGIAAQTVGMYFGSTLEETSHLSLSHLRFLNHASGIANGGSWSLFDSDLYMVDFYNCTVVGFEVAGSGINIVGCKFRVCGWGMSIKYLNGNNIGGPTVFGSKWISNTFDIVLVGTTIRQAVFEACWFEQCATAVLGSTGGAHFLQTFSFDKCLFQPGVTAGGNGTVSISAGTFSGLMEFDNCVVYNSPLAAATLPAQEIGTANFSFKRMNCVVTNGTGAGTTKLANVVSGGALNLLSGADVTGSAIFRGDIFRDGAAGAARVVQFYTNNVPRWNTGMAGNAETGSNVGSDWVLNRFSDAGASIDQPIRVARDTGLVTLSVGTADPNGRLQAMPRTTTAALNSIANAINTTNKFTGKAVINTTTGTIVTASGATAGAVWQALDGTTAFTPV